MQEIADKICSNLVKNEGSKKFISEVLN